MGKFELSSIKLIVSAQQEYERLCQNSNVESIDKICVTDDTITILLLNVMSL